MFPEVFKDRLIFWKICSFPELDEKAAIALRQAARRLNPSEDNTIRLVNGNAHTLKRRILYVYRH